MVIANGIVNIGTGNYWKMVLETFEDGNIGKIGKWNWKIRLEKLENGIEFW